MAMLTYLGKGAMRSAKAKVKTASELKSSINKGCNPLSPAEILDSIAQTAPEEQTNDALNSIENSIYRTAFKLRSVQTLCQLDLIDSSLVHHLLRHQRFWELRESVLSVQQLFQTLQELFERVRVEKPGQMHPRSSELTLSLLMAMYDSTGTGFLKLTSAAAALIALSGDSPLTKYRALFQLYAENNRGRYESEPRMTRRILRNLLTDLHQIPTVVGESRALCSVESATRSCFQGVLSPTIKEEKFLSWLQSEPPILLWLPTAYRLSITEAVTHPVRCSLCSNFPITGLRYRCLKCLNFDICQMCFLSGVHSKSHQKSHPVIEHCVQISAKENTKLLLRTLRNNLLQGRCRRKEAERRQRLLAQVEPEGVAHHAQARLFKRQLNRCKDKLQALYTSQEEKSCIFETKIHQLTTNQESLWARIQQMGQDLQAVLLQPLPPSSSSCQNTALKSEHSLAERFWRKDDLSQVKSNAEEGSGGNPVLNASVVGGNDQHQTNTERAPLNPESSQGSLQERSRPSSRKQSHAHKTQKETFLGTQERSLRDIPPVVPAAMSSSALASAERRKTANTEEREDELGEEDLQEFLSKCMDAFTLKMTSGSQASVNTDLYFGAEKVGRAFSALIDQITLPSLK
ncbi:PREDICTED: dystrotelin [Elephantulus edwardii]|uniref:dystrotelin n=1 Tax=Elephantulus edwardii TaxID=28737 RepID=UPI0003F080A3|nr:PREDICTED: dystrotelin [Elephantulus edwardii]